MSDMTSDAKQLKIEEFDLVSFVMQIQAAILQGYEVTDKSEEAPMQIGGSFHLIMREAITPVKVVETFVVSASIDTTKLQEQLKAGGEIEQMIADSLVVEGEGGDKAEDLHGNLMEIIPITNDYTPDTPIPEPTIDEALPKEEQPAVQVIEQPKQTTKRGRK